MRKARYIFTVVIGCLAFFYSNAQKNLILNGGMEDTLYCNIAGAGNIQQFTHWYNPTANSSFAFHYCNYFNPGNPGSHSGYGGAIACSYNPPTPDAFNYIAGNFSQPLIAGKKYCFTMYVKLDFPFKHGSDNLAFFTHNGVAFYNTYYLVPISPKVTISYTVIDTLYSQFKGTFTASGGETDFIIGGYKSYSGANYPLIFQSAPFDGSVFVYDDFSLTEVGPPQLGNDQTICTQSDSLLLGDSAWVETKYKWYENGILIDTVHSQIKVKPSSTTTYVLQQENCVLTSDTITIHFVEDCSQLTDGIHIPNVFTPNGDGFNDTFKITTETGMDIQGAIYNRWGNLIYESNRSGDNTFLWDGHTTSGEACNDGNYFFVMTYVDSKGKQKTIKGFVTLFR